ncbi:hypothetical protein [Celeribacter ethanolicus]|uniref:hypothetical protein n=1 Tax=Celeribacter ethanolicus TaxID=1758178 RepID=UPI00082CB3E0|nr:hypothetical protein [Celeribacter ethanolicus]
MDELSLRKTVTPCSGDACLRPKTKGEEPSEGSRAQEETGCYPGAIDVMGNIPEGSETGTVHDMTETKYDEFLMLLTTLLPAELCKDRDAMYKAIIDFSFVDPESARALARFVNSIPEELFYRAAER